MLVVNVRLVFCVDFLRKSLSRVIKLLNCIYLEEYLDAERYQD